MQKRKPMQQFCPYYTPQVQVEGYLKFFFKKTRKYPTTPSRGVFKIFEKKIGKYPASPREGYNKDKNSSFFRVPSNSKWIGTRKSEKVGHF